jgi:hypothetical protein
LSGAIDLVERGRMLLTPGAQREENRLQREAERGRGGFDARRDLSLASVADAHRAIESRDTVGKIVLLPWG